MRKKNNNRLGWWQLIGVGVVSGVFVASLLNINKSVAWLDNPREVMVRAAKAGDYETAQKLYEQCQVTQCRYGDMSKVLGAESELEELVYPERVLEREIERYEALNLKYPGHRDILLTLAKLYGELGNMVLQSKYWEEARESDPNNPLFEIRN